MERAIRAKQVINRIIERTDHSIVFHAEPDLEGLPEWVQEAWDNGMLIMAADDEFTGLWIVTPFGYAIRSEGNDILVNRGGHYVCLWQDLK